MKKIAICIILLTLAVQSGTQAHASGFKIDGGSVPLTANTRVLIPSAPERLTRSAGGSVLDASNIADGYIGCKSTSNKRVKVRILYESGITYTYDLRNDGVYEFFPLSGGNGTYGIQILHQLYDDQYVQALATSIDVQFRDNLLPFLYPNQFVNYTANSKCVQLGGELAGRAGSDLETLAGIYNYVINNITYDSDKAEMAKSGQLAGYIPDLDQILATKKGICFDYAALMSAMLRSQQIPTRMEFGYVSGGEYHAWISAYLHELGWVNGVIRFDGTSWKLLDPTFAAGGNSSPGIMKYIGDEKNYRTQYIY